MTRIRMWGGLLQLLFVLALLAAALWLRPAVGRLEPDTLGLLGYLPWLLTAITAILAWQFNQLKFLLLATVTAAAYWVLQTRLQVPLHHASAAEAYAALSHALPLVFLTLLILPEPGILSSRGLATVAAVIGLSLIAGGLAPRFAGSFPQYGEWFTLRAVPELVLSWSATALFITAGIAGLVALWWRNTACELAILGTGVATFLVMGLLQLEHISISLFTAAGCVQLFGIIRSSHAMAYRDELTGLLGRRALNERLKSLGRRYSIAMLDVDHFKKFNDSNGHDVGDEALRLVASRISRVRGGGTAFRYGGEEFCVVFPRRELQQCIEPLEEVRQAIADYRITLRDRGHRPSGKREGSRRRGCMATRIPHGTVNVTISLGLAERGPGGATPQEVIRAADAQLYRAKRSGRNRLSFD